MWLNMIVLLRVLQRWEEAPLYIEIHVAGPDNETCHMTYAACQIPAFIDTVTRGEYALDTYINVLGLSPFNVVFLGRI